MLSHWLAPCWPRQSFITPVLGTISVITAQRCNKVCPRPAQPPPYTLFSHLFLWYRAHRGFPSFVFMFTRSSKWKNFMIGKNHTRFPIILTWISPNFVRFLHSCRLWCWCRLWRWRWCRFWRRSRHWQLTTCSVLVGPSNFP